MWFGKVVIITPDRPCILHVFPSFSAGGAQARLVTLANAFGDAYRHQIVALDGDTSFGTRFDVGVDVDFLDVTLPRRTSLKKLRLIYQVLRRQKPDLLVTSNWGSIDWALANHWPRLTHIHIEDGFGPHEQDRQIPRRIITRRLVLRRAKLVLPSRILLSLAGDVWRLPRPHLHYIPNGIDHQRFTPAVSSPSGLPIIGCVAALRPEKNLARLLYAAARLKANYKFSLVIAGDGPERGYLEGLSKSLGVNAQFLGNVADPAPLYRSFTIFVLSSDTEQMPLSVLEAMSAGLPIAATLVGDISAMVAPENHEFLTLRDDIALAEAIGRLLERPKRARSIGIANRQRVDAEFGQSAMIQSWRSVIDGCLQGQRSPVDGKIAGTIVDQIRNGQRSI